VRTDPPRDGQIHEPDRERGEERARDGEGEQVRARHASPHATTDAPVATPYVYGDLPMVSDISVASPWRLRDAQAPTAPDPPFAHLARIARPPAGTVA